MVCDEKRWQKEFKKKGCSFGERNGGILSNSILPVACCRVGAVGVVASSGIAIATVISSRVIIVMNRLRR